MFIVRKKGLTLLVVLLAALLFILISGCNDKSADVNKNDVSAEVYLISSGQTQDGFEYRIFSDGIVVLGSYKGSETEVNVPAEVEAKPVNTLSNTFSLNKKIISVNLPDTIKEIGYRTFYGCKKLEQVNIPKSVTTIGGNAFMACISLTNITIPQTVTKIGESAFRNCSSLTSIVIPNSVKDIGHSAFFGCKNLENVNISHGITQIGDSVFLGCEKLASIEIPDNITEIGRLAFEHCISLTDITIPQTVTKIGLASFANCSSLTIIAIPNSVIEMGDSVFSGCKNLENVTIPDDITRISDYIFSGCENLQSVDIPDSVKEIGEYAFSGCISLSDIALPNTITKVEDGAFRNCSSLTSILISDSVTEIGKQAFEDCSALESITIPNSINSIGEHAFKNTAWLNESQNQEFVVAGNGILIDINLSNDVTELIIPNNVKKIGSLLPYENQIENIYFPQSLIDFNNDFLSHTSKVKSITVHKDNKHFTAINGVLFNKDLTQLLYYPKDKKDISYQIPQGVNSYATLMDNSYLKNLIIPVSVFSFNKQKIEELKQDLDIDEQHSVTFYNTFYEEFSRQCQNLDTISFEQAQWGDSKAIENALRKYNENLNIVWGYEGE